MPKHGWSAVAYARARMMYIAFAGGALLPLAVAPVLADDIPALIKALSGSEPDKRAAAAEALVKAGPDAVEPLIAWAHNDTTRARAERILAKMGVKAVAALMRLLDDPEKQIKAGGALSRVVTPDSLGYVPAFASCVREKPHVKNYCGVALVLACSEGTGDQTALLVKSLKDSDHGLRMYAAVALGRSGGGKEVVAALSAALKDREFSVRGAAAGSLGRLGRKAKAAVPALLELAREGNGELRRTAEEALKSING